MIRDVVRAGSEVACGCMELRSSSGPWARLRPVLSELGASPSSNSGLVSSSTEPHLKLVIASVDLWNERRNGSERGIEILPRRPRRCGVLCVGFASLFLAIRGPRRPRCPTPDRPQARTYALNYSALLAVLQNR